VRLASFFLVLVWLMSLPLMSGYWLGPSTTSRDVVERGIGRRHFTFAAEAE
jgi:hypothetical protein